MAVLYSLTDPCPKCPFRSDITPYLSYVRASEIAASLKLGADFPCHQTVDYDEDDPEVGKRARFCAGALITMERAGEPNQIMRIAERLGLYDMTKLNMEAPVYDSLDEWVDSHE